MKKITSQKAITLVALIITVILLLILATTVIVNLEKSDSKVRLNKMFADLKLLQEKVLVYYNKNGELPKTNRTIGLFEPEITYWEIDLSKLEGLTLHYGKGYGKQENLEFNVSDVYVINDNLEIVYLRGIEHNGRSYYQNENDEKQVDDLNQKTIRVNIKEGGTVEGWGQGAKRFRLGETVTLKAVPGKITANGVDYYYDFEGWYLDDVLLSTNLEYTITVTKDATYEAKFSPTATFVYYANGDIVVDQNTTITQSSGYMQDTNITKVIVGNKVTSIGAGAFSGCTSLALTSLPPGVTSIGTNAFQGCTSLTEIDLKNVEIIGGGSFRKCTNLRKIIAPKAKQINSSYAFSENSTLEEIQFGSVGYPVERIDGSSFWSCDNNKLTIKIYIADEETSLAGAPGGSTFATIEYYNARTGELVNLRWGAKYKGDTTIDWTELPNANLITGAIVTSAFSGCTSLALTEIPEGVRSIDNSTFSGCTSLTNIDLKNVEAIGAYTFNQCSNLRVVKAKKVKTVGTNCFRSCPSLEDVELGSVGYPVEGLNKEAFYGGNNPYNLTIKIYIADGETSLANQPWYAGSATIEYYNARTGELVNLRWGAKYKGDKTINWTELPNANLITGIVGSAFQGCTSLALTSLPQGLTSIADQAFYNCTSLEITEIPEGVTSIGGSAFRGCTSLTEIDLKNVETVGSYAFYNCNNLEEIKAQKAKTIGQDAFGNSGKLQVVELGSIGNPVTTINSYAFRYSSQNTLRIKVYIDTTEGATSLSGEPWGATNATIEYYDAATGTKIN